MVQLAERRSKQLQQDNLGKELFDCILKIIRLPSYFITDENVRAQKQ